MFPAALRKHRADLVRSDQTGLDAPACRPPGRRIEDDHPGL